MISICYICLSTDRTLQPLKEPLSNWHDELCDFQIEDYALYCSECAYMLNKFHSFKVKCQQANKILKKWKNQNPKVRIKPSRLKKKMAPSSLSVSNSKNHRIYYYQDIQDTNNQNDSINTLITCPINNITGQSGFLIDTSVAQETNLDTFMFNVDISAANINPSVSNINYVKDFSSEKHPDNPNITVKNSTCELKIEPCIENELLQECEVKLENDVLNNTEIIVSEQLQLKNDIDNNDGNDSDHNITTDDSDCGDFDVEKLFRKNLDSDNSSDDEILLKKRKKSLKTDCNIKRPKKKDIKEEADGDIPLSKLKKKVVEVKKNNNSPEKKVKKVRIPLKKLNKDLIKHNLLCKFGDKEVKDEDGNILDKDSIIDSLDKVHKLTLRKVERQCLGPKPFTSEALQVLSQIQKRYGNQFSSVFTTVHLSTMEQELEEFNKRQQHESYLASEHKCSLCYRWFKHKTQLEYHINEYHNSDQRPHGCQICKMRFKDAQGMRRHVRTHRVIYKCKLCPLVTNFSSVMETHYNQHNGVKHICELCKAELNSRTSLYAHLNSMHPSRHIFCPLCARTFNSEYGLTQHKLRKHPKEEIALGPDSAHCDACDVTFVSDAVYQTHINKSHTDNSICTIKRRKITEKRRRPNMVCRVCKKVEHSMGRLKLHFKTEHPLETDTVSMCLQTIYNHLCHECGKGFKNVGDLNEHKHLHTGAKPYACDKCPKTFHRKINLRGHLERHFPPTRECPHCGKKFISASNLNNHIKTHIGLRPYTCELCEKSFLQRGALDEHVRGVHLRIRRARKQNGEVGTE